MIALQDGAPCPACEERRRINEVPRVLNRRVPVSTRIWSGPLSNEATTETMNAVAGGPESIPGAEEPMAEAADSTERRVCSVCHETPLRSHNRSGICTQCKRSARTTARPALAARVAGPAEDGVWPPIVDAPDEYLVEAAQELANRITRIRAEAETRLEKLNGALEVLKRARED
jgi:hypothetical protein